MLVNLLVEKRHTLTRSLFEGHKTQHYFMSRQLIDWGTGSRVNEGK